MDKNSQFKIPKIRINAEHQRLLWLNFSPSLCLGIVLIYLLFAYICYNPVDYQFDPNDYYQTLIQIGVSAYGLSLLLLIMLIRRSLLNDMQNNFWDQIRMSSLSVWQIAWTRLFTAPITAWLSILIATALIIYARHTDAETTTLQILAEIGLSLLIALVVAMLSLLNYLQSKRSEQEWQGTTVQLMLLVLLCFSIKFYLFIILLNKSELIQGASINELYYYLGLLLISSSLLLIGLLYSLRQKLHLKSSLLYWHLLGISFVWIIYAYNFFCWGLAPTTWILSSCSFYYFATILSLIVQDNRCTTLQQVHKTFKQKQWLKCLSIAPSWLILMPLYIATGLLALVIKDPFALDYFVEEYAYQLLSLICLAGLVLFTLRRKQKFNPISLSMIIFILGSLLYRFSQLIH